MDKLDKLIDAVALILEEKEPPNELALKKFVEAQASVIELTALDGEEEPYSTDEIEEAVRTLKAKFDIRMNFGTIFEADDHKPWLVNRQGEIEWYYWERYRKHLLTTKSFPPHVVHALDNDTDEILDHLEDPSKDGPWSMRGLVVGHVQSGKTANYTGVICKAADAGYRVIIVLAGLLNSLRNQTQERIDSDFMGWCTRLKEHIGVSRFETGSTPVCFTTSVEDFKKATANAIAMKLDALNVPVVLVLKKNKSTLENLHKWLLEHNRRDLKDSSMLMIDDEADHASVNTNKDNKDPTAINRAIRNLLALFDRSSFVGYTATPFANIFIDPESENEMLNGELYKDLFPRDFILSLDPPTNYVGPHRIFTDEGDLHCVRLIDDNEDTLPVKHKIDLIPSSLPDSLVNALNCFLIARSIRFLRGQEDRHHSMMINASRFTNVQNLIKGLVLDRVKDLRRNIGNYAALPPNQALQNSVIASIYETWKAEYSGLEFEWSEIQKCLKASVDPAEVICVNSSSRENLDYSRDNYSTGRCVIAVGGLGLSRGLTLEGLIVSYFLRNSIMYDTLMQMGRWFGYRDGYADVCRIFMTADAEAWYSHIAEATEELRGDFRSMQRAKLTPLEFGLRVRSHPTALIVTARNKMRASKEIPVSISLAGRLAETSVVLAAPEQLNANRNVLEQTVKSASAAGIATDCNLGHLWKSVPSSIVATAIENFQNHPECMLTYSEPLIEYIDWLSANGTGKFDLLLRSVKGNASTVEIAGRTISPPERTVAGSTNIERRIEFAKRRVASKGDERAGLKKTEIDSIRANYTGKNLPDREYRKYRHSHRLAPLFMINFVKIKLSKDEDPLDILVPTFSVSFPGDPSSSRRPEKLVQYRVNTVWWEKNYYTPDEEEEEDE